MNAISTGAPPEESDYDPFHWVPAGHDFIRMKDLRLVLPPTNITLVPPDEVEDFRKNYQQVRYSFDNPPATAKNESDDKEKEKKRLP